MRNLFCLAMLAAAANCATAEPVLVPAQPVAQVNPPLVPPPASDETGSPPPLVVAQNEPSGKASAPSEGKFSDAQLDEMLAPIALYPDTALMQVLIASTYPLEVVEAARWQKQHSDLKGDALDKALEAKDWDDSIKSLTQFPDLLAHMSDNLDWTKDLGDAFLAQKGQVLDAAQRMRARADKAGSLKSNDKQKVVKEHDTIIIEPADPSVVYIPSYSPSVVYGGYAPAAPYYPGVWGWGAGALAFGAGVATGALIGASCNWVARGVYAGHWHGHGSIDRNVSRDVNRNVNRNVNREWSHNSAHRRNVGYRDASTSQRYEGARRTEMRQNAGGFERGAGQRGQGPGAQGLGGGRGQGAGAQGLGGGRGQGAQGSRGGGSYSSAFGGGGGAQRDSMRGASSRQGRSFSGSPSGGYGGGGRGGFGGGGRGGGGRGGGGRR